MQIFEALPGPFINTRSDMSAIHSKLWIYVGTYTHGDGKGIYRYE